MADDGVHRPVCVERPMLDSSGNICRIKAWVLSTGACAWELRRLFMNMQFRMQKGPYRLILDQREQWLAEVESLGFDTAGMLAMSRRQASYHMLEVDESTHEESTISTVGLVIVLLLWCTQRRRLDEQALAYALLCTLIAATVPDDDRMLVMNFALDADWLVECPAHVLKTDGLVGACPHVSTHGVQVAQAYAAHSHPIHRFVSALRCLFSLRALCPSLRAWCAKLVLQVSEAVDLHMQSASGVDIVKFNESEPRKRGTRYDEDYKRALSFELVKSKRIRRTTDWSRTSGSLPSSTAWTFDETLLTAYMASARSELSGARFLSICFDGTRLGQPKREVNIYHAWSNDKQIGCWLAPQVPPVGPLGDPSARGGVRSIFDSSLWRNSGGEASVPGSRPATLRAAASETGWREVSPTS